MESSSNDTIKNAHQSKEMNGNENLLLQTHAVRPTVRKRGVFRLLPPGSLLYLVVGVTALWLAITVGLVVMTLYYQSQAYILKLERDQVIMDYENLNKTLDQIYVMESNRILIESLTNEIEQVKGSTHKLVQEKNEHIKRLQLELGLLKSHPEMLKSDMDGDLANDGIEVNDFKENDYSKWQNGTTDNTRIHNMEKVLTSLKVNITSRIQNSKLFLAIDQMDIISVKVLVSRGADVNGRNNVSQTPLHRAAMCSNNSVAIQITKILINTGADASAKDGKGHTFLHKLVDDESPLPPHQFHDIAEYLISKDLSKLFNMPGDYFRIFDTPRWSYLYRLSTPFQIAVKNIEIDTPTLTLLKSNGVNFNAVNSNKDSVLFYALMGNGSTRLLFDLVNLGANWRHLNNYNSSFLHRSAVFGNLEQLKFFLDLGLDVNAVNSYENTPLHVAVSWNNGHVYGMVKLLIERGADVKIKDSYGHNALDMALMRNNMSYRDEVIQMLKDA